MELGRDRRENRLVLAHRPDDLEGIDEIEEPVRFRHPPIADIRAAQKVGVAGQVDDAHRTELRDLSSDLDPTAAIAEIDVDDRVARMRLAGERECALRRRGNTRDGVAGNPNTVLQGIGNRLIVLDDQDASVERAHSN